MKLTQDQLNALTPEQKVDYFTALYASHHAEYSAERDPKTGECDFSPTFIFDIYLENMRLTYGRENTHHYVNGARLAMDVAA